MVKLHWMYIIFVFLCYLGLSGTLYFLQDILQPQTARFPAFQPDDY